MELHNGFNNPQQPHRILLEGSSGTGKTFSSILLAKGLTGGDMSKVVLIDTTGQPSSMYRHLGNFSTIQLGPPFLPARFNDAMELAHDAGATVILIDSLSDEYSGENGLVDRLHGDGYQTALQAHRALFFRIRHADVPVIATVRIRTKIVQVNGCGKWVRRPLKMPVQEEGIEQHFTTVLRLDRKHRAHVVKDCTNLFTQSAAEPITTQSGIRLQQWYQSATPELPEDLQQQINDCGSVPELHRLLSRTDLADIELISFFTKRRLELEDEADNEMALGKGVDRLQMIPGEML